MSSIAIALPAVQSRHAANPCPADRLAILDGTPTMAHAATLTLTVKNTEHVYALTLLPCDFGKGWRLTKASDGECYDLHSDTRFPGAVECQCMGYLRWQHCKHADALQALIAEGSLS